jgi:tripartite ATP-independent transporter DctM subunit
MLHMSPEAATIGMFLSLLFGIFIGVPLGLVLGGLALIFGFTLLGVPATLSMFVTRIYGVMDNYILVSVPLFIFMAQLLSRSGVAEVLFETVRYLFGPVRGGIAITVVVVSTIFAACTGITGAACVTMGLLALPTMLRYGYDKRLSCGCITGASALGILIPPSIMLIIMAEQTGLTVGKLFAGAIIPGIALSSMYIIYILIRCYFNPLDAPALPPEERAKISSKELIVMTLKSFVPPTLLIIGVLGAMFAGVATPTEAAGSGAFLSFLLVLAYRKFTWKGFYETVIQATKSTCMVLLVLVGASCFTGVFMGIGGDAIIRDLIIGLNLGKWGTYIIMMVIFFILGCFLDYIAIIMLTFPIFLPIAKEMGFDLLWWVVSVAVMLQDSFITPPFGYNLFYLKGCAPPEVSMTDIIRGSIPFWEIMELGLVFVCFFPWSITWLPSILIK